MKQRAWLSGLRTLSILIATRIEGAEDERYLSSAFPYRAPNRPLASVSELRAVDEITPELYRLIAPFLTVWPAEGSKVNLLTAPPKSWRAQ